MFATNNDTLTSEKENIKVINLDNKICIKDNSALKLDDPNRRGTAPKSPKSPSPNMDSDVTRDESGQVYTAQIDAIFDDISNLVDDQGKYHKLVIHLLERISQYRELFPQEQAALQLYKERGEEPTTFVHPFNLIDPENEPQMTLLNRVKWNKAYNTERLATFANKTGMKS